MKDNEDVIINNQDSRILELITLKNKDFYPDLKMNKSYVFYNDFLDEYTVVLDVLY